MAASTVTRAYSNASDADFRLWGKAISDALAAGGMVLVADSGDIDWTTVTRPLAINTAQGYEIWRSDDAAGALDNFYFKVEYGSGSGSASNPAIWITVGWGSDGAGTLTGNVNARVQILSVVNSTTLLSCNFGIGPSYAAIGMFVSLTNANLFFSIERTRDPEGAEQNEVFVWGRDGSIRLNQVVPHTGTISANVTNDGAGVRGSTVASFVYGSNIGLATIAPQKGGFLMESLNLFGGDSTNYNTGQQQYVFTVYGASHTYILAVGGTSKLASSVVAVPFNLLMRYE